MEEVMVAAQSGTLLRTLKVFLKSKVPTRREGGFSSHVFYLLSSISVTPIYTSWVCNCQLTSPQITTGEHCDLLTLGL